MNSFSSASILFATVLLACPLGFSAETVPSWKKDVAPILRANCYRCHGATTRKAELDLRNAVGLRRGGETGSLLERGQPDESLLFEMVDNGLMPPKEGEQLTTAEIEVIRRWIAGGAAGLPQVDETIATEGGASQVTQHDVLPLLFRRCTVCHGAPYLEGNLDFRTRSSILASGAVAPGKPGQSAMVQRVRDERCPPSEDIGEAGIEPMTADELEVVEKWILLGSPGSSSGQAMAVTAESDPLITEEERQFWAFQTPKKSSPPTVEKSHRARNPIDSFLLARLKERGLEFSPKADKLTLLRRASLDLTGIPPTPNEIAEFLGDKSSHAYQRLIDRLLNSPRYGERWGRMWLDLSGYADSEGKRNADTVRPWAWRYRDYVVRSFNEDKPYDQFLLEQIAGDELVDYADSETVSEETIQKLLATGFLRMAPDGTAADPVNRISDRVEVIADEIDVLSRGIMGLTMDCARCHSHKYDPLPQRDYYRMVAIFKGAYDEYNWLVPQGSGNQWKKAQSRYLTLATQAERDDVEAHNRPIHEQIERLENELDQESQDKKRTKQLGNEIKTLKTKLRELPKIRALWDRGQPSPTYVYRRGDEMQPGRLVDAGIPSALAVAAPPVEIEPLQHSVPKTGRRLAFARWLIRPDHPLTARVFVNRIWQQHFGTGIVKSLDNFGELGTPPSHPELLDWLAVEFVENGWSTKHLHRLIMTSTAYRQSSVLMQSHRQLDPENRLLSRMPMRRMSAEEVRDSILFVAGRLDEKPFGKPAPVDVRKDGLVTSKPMAGRWRRSVYVQQRRKEMPSLLETFDLPQMTPNCIQRTDSTVVSQPLHLLNNEMVHDLAGSLAQGVRREAGPEVAKQIRHAWLSTLIRPPTDEELEASLDSIAELTKGWQAELTETNGGNSAQQNALRDYCHALINSAGFLYID